MSLVYASLGALLFTCVGLTPKYTSEIRVTSQESEKALKQTELAHRVYRDLMCFSETAWYKMTLILLSTGATAIHSLSL